MHVEDQRRMCAKYETRNLIHYTLNHHEAEDSAAKGPAHCWFHDQRLPGMWMCVTCHRCRVCRASATHTLPQNARAQRL